MIDVSFIKHPYYVNFYYNITITLFLLKNLLLIEKNINKISRNSYLETEQSFDCKLLLLLNFRKIFYKYKEWIDLSKYLTNTLTFYIVHE